MDLWTALIGGLTSQQLANDPGGIRWGRRRGRVRSLPAVRVLAACSLGGAGHLNPLLAFLAAAERRGDETLVIGPPAVREMVERTGFWFAAGGEPPEAAVAAIRERLPVAPPFEASVLGNRELFGRLATSAMLERMEEVCAEWRPDIVLRDPCEYASAVIAHPRGIPTAQVAISLAEAEAGSIAVAAPALEEFRVGLVAELRASPYLTRFPARLDPSPFATTLRFREPGAPEAEPLPDWWNGSRAPLIYMTFGTVLGRMSIAAGVYRAALQAVREGPARVLLTVGRTFDVADLGPVPEHVHVEPWIDQAQVLAEAHVVVCHGGSGTVFGALAAGVPVAVVPLFADQFENGRRVARAGAGLIVESSADPPGRARRVITDADAPSIAAAIEEVLHTAAYAQEARRIAQEMATTPTADDVLDALLSGRVD
jgi:UDP:flavonoid glycosyltransferase YjiC (YdhE family)